MTIFDLRSRVHTDTEIVDCLDALWHAQDGLGRAVPVREVKIYQAGFRAALEAVGLAVGVEWRPVQAKQPKTLPAEFDAKF